MNERILELANEANKDIGYTFKMEEAKQIHELMEKFAELIVKEMCGMMEQCEDDVYALEPSERPTEYIEWLYKWRTRFNEHFGIE